MQEAMVAVALLGEVQEAAGADKSGFRFKNQSENLWLAKMQKVTIALGCELRTQYGIIA